MMNILKVCPLWQRRVEDQGSPMALLDSREFGLALGRVLVYGDREIAAHRIGVHDGHHIHRAAFPLCANMTETSLVTAISEQGGKENQYGNDERFCPARCGCDGSI
jgi:hypothetical protein